MWGNICVASTRNGGKNKRLYEKEWNLSVKLLYSC